MPQDTRGNGAGMAEALLLTVICSVAVQVRSLDRSLAFCRDLLGLRLGTGTIGSRSCADKVAPTLVLLEVGERAVHHAGGPGRADRVAGRQASGSRPRRTSVESHCPPCADCGIPT